MGAIHVLDFSVANLIAAGEVVDRPASVIKELVENAIDAGGTRIAIDIRNGGVRMMRVTDNGCGMSADDLPIALKRHATSKIQDANDLLRITTLGFRGEALAAIAAVSTLHIISKRRNDDVGHVLTAKDGKVIDIEEVGCADGTTVLVEHLFENFPARRKFLKKDATEAMAIGAVVEKAALSRPDVSFSFTVDGQEKFVTPGDGSLPHVLRALYGEVASRMLHVSGETFGIRVEGYVGRSDATKNNRNEQNFFLNGRIVRSKTMMAALERAYVSYIAPERFPICALYVTLDPSSVDVNVHPAKLEVKFSDERRVFEAVYYAVRAALENNTERPTLETLAERHETKEEKGLKLKSMPSPTEANIEQLTLQTANQSPLDVVKTAESATPTRVDEPLFASAQGVQAVSGALKTNPLEAPTRECVSIRADIEKVCPPNKDGIAISPVTEPSHDRTKTDAAPNESEGIAPTDAFGKEDTAVQSDEAATPKSQALPHYRYVGTLFRCYVILELDDRFLLIDQHAAHERILFEELKAKQSSGAAFSQELMIPLSVRLSAEEYAAALEYRDDLSAVGMHFECNQGQAVGSASLVYLTAIPNAITPYDAESLFVSMVDELSRGIGNPQSTESARRERALYQVACKAAIKGHRSYDEAHIDWLCKKILSLPDITVCPHGRPIAITLTKSELDHQFNRI